MAENKSRSNEVLKLKINLDENIYITKDKAKYIFVIIYLCCVVLCYVVLGCVCVNFFVFFVSFT